MTEMVIRIILTIIILIVMIIILSKFKRRNTDEGPDDSLTILKKRFEKGEITKEAYEEARKRRGK